MIVRVILAYVIHNIYQTFSMIRYYQLLEGSTSYASLTQACPPQGRTFHVMQCLVMNFHELEETPPDVTIVCLDVCGGRFQR
jgi:hypothetical protein